MGNSGIGVPLPELAAYCREAAAEGAVLLKNEGHMLPVKKDETVSIFGRSQIEYYRSGTGSGGAVNVPYVKNILDGIKENNAFPVNEELVETYKEWLKEHPFDNGGGGWAAEPWHQEEMEITEEIACRAAEKSKKAVFLIGRTAGEDKDYEAMGATFMDEDGKEKPLIMGCYGVGVSRSLAAVVEQHNDEHGIVWPVSVAPYEVAVIPLDPKKEECANVCDQIVEGLCAEGIEVVVDDRDERPGFKFADNDLMGFPYQVVLGKRGLKNGTVELKDRATGEREDVAIDEVVAKIAELVKAARR